MAKILRGGANTQAIRLLEPAADDDVRQARQPRDSVRSGEGQAEKPSYRSEIPGFFVGNSKKKLVTDQESRNSHIFATG